jgi:hypothetical protein
MRSGSCNSESESESSGEEEEEDTEIVDERKDSQARLVGKESGEEREDWRPGASRTIRTRCNPDRPAGNKGGQKEKNQSSEISLSGLSLSGVK